MDKNIINLNYFHYDIGAAGFKRLGNPKNHPEVDFSWHASETNRFIHWNYSRVWYVAKGYGTVETTAGKFELTEGNAYFIPQNSLITANCPDYMEQYFIDFLCLSDFIPLENMFSFKTVSQDSAIVLELLKSIIRDKKWTTDLQKFRSHCSINSLISHFVTGYKVNLEKFTPFFQVIKDINDNYKKPISIQKLSDSIGYNSEYFSRSFKSTFGVSPQTYLINKRLSVAKHLLLTTDLPIATVATECGYPDPLYFTKAFTKLVGCSPKAFRIITGRNVE